MEVKGIKHIDTILDAFAIEGVDSVYPYGNGHIHDTYLVRTKSAGKDFILQRMNTFVFGDINSLMKNISLVTRHLAGIAGVRTIDLRTTSSGENYFLDKENDAWRVFSFLPGTKIHERISDPGLAYEAGKAMGEFQAGLTTLEEELHQTLSHFHDIRFRKKEWEQALEDGKKERLKESRDTIDDYRSRMDGMEKFHEQLKRLPLRVTHNDTKVNNILFDDAGRSVCMIDLDTVMPGYVHFDYGDALRTLANKAEEDEKDLDKVKFDMQLFKSFTRGYRNAAGSFLTPEEKELLPFSVLYMTFLIGLRFLTDHLLGDVYFRTEYQGHNLVRAKAQMKLLKDVEFHFEEILLTFI